MPVSTYLLPDFPDDQIDLFIPYRGNGTYCTDPQKDYMVPLAL